MIFCIDGYVIIWLIIDSVKLFLQKTTIYDIGLQVVL